MATRLPPACLFDMDGTLIDSYQLILDAWKHAHHVVCPNLEFDEPKLISLFGRPSMEVIKGVGIPEELQEAYLKEFRSYMQQHLDEVPLKKGVEKILKFLHERRVRMAVVTGARTSSAKYLLTRLGIIEYFDSIIGADATKKGKPHPEPIYTALKQLRINEILKCITFVGDSINDVIAAHSAGITPIYLCHSSDHSLHSKVNTCNGHVIHELNELIPLLESMCN